jgi:hypothetical protein
MGKLKIKVSPISYDEIARRDRANKHLIFLFWTILCLSLANWAWDISLRTSYFSDTSSGISKQAETEN